jgi:exopolyphosphatase/guanosine-5'-triphosphate,3'-diphosphate pyrophosphatase
MIFAAIDIGSNSVRCLYSYVFEQNQKAIFKTRELIRLPIRLGDDSFNYDQIENDKIEKLIAAISAFKELMKVYDVIAYRACATSAMRNAKNGKEIIERIKVKTCIEVEIIDGKTEAEIILSNHVEKFLDSNCSYLYIDVGGGSVEVTLLSKGKVVSSECFQLGTIRFLVDKVNKAEWEHFKVWIKKNVSNVVPIIAIGTGGNINKVFKMSGKKDGKLLSLEEIKNISDKICSYSYNERITELGLNPDRADVIVPALKLFISAMKHGNIDKMLVPQIGLSDGMINQLYETYKVNPKVENTPTFHRIPTN